MSIYARISAAANAIFFDASPNCPYRHYGNGFITPFNAPVISFDPVRLESKTPNEFIEIANTWITLFHSVDQYVAYHKARLFDPDRCQDILVSRNPSEIKRISTSIRNFDNSKWLANRKIIYLIAMYCKFSTPDMREHVVADYPKMLYQCSKGEFGIGLTIEELRSVNIHTVTFSDHNLTGGLLFRVREAIYQNHPIESLIGN